MPLKTDWHGSFVAVVTPFDADGAIDERAYLRNIDTLLDEGADGFVIAGCTGEVWALTDGERERVFVLAVERVAGRAVVIGNASTMLTEHAVAIGDRAKRAGCDGIMVTPPYYILPNEKEVVAHYRAISDAVDLPILMYNIPKRIGVNLTPNLVSRLADEVRNAVAIKESSNDFMQTVETIRVAGDRVAVLTGHSCERGFPALAMGARGFVSSVESQVMGREAVQLYALAAGGHFDEARRVQQRCIAVDHGVHGLGTFPSGLKAAMNLVGRPGGLPRGPLQALDAAQLATMRSVLEELGLIPQPALA